MIRLLEFNKVFNYNIFNVEHRLSNMLIISILFGYIMHYIAYSEYTLGFIYPISSMGVALTVLKHRQLLKYFIFTFYSIAFYYVVLILLNIPAGDWGKGSENHVVNFLLPFVFIPWVVQIRERLKINLIPLFLIIIFAIYTDARSAVLLSSIIAIGFALKYLRFNKKYIILIPIVLLLYYNDILLMFQQSGFYNDFLDGSLSYEPRIVIIRNYLNDMDALKIFFGYPGYSYSLSGRILGITTHNTYIELHSIIGIFIVPVIFCLIVVSAKLFKNNYSMFIILLATLVRASSDSIMFFTNVALTSVVFILILSINDDLVVESYQKGNRYRS